MKKVCMYISVLITVCFMLPAIFTNTNKQTSSHVNDVSQSLQSNEENSNFDGEIKQSSDSKEIKLLHSKTGEIQEINLDEYLYGVVSSEMPASFEQEALKAQAVVARTYTIYTIIHSNNKHEGASICDDSKCCQAWITKEDRLSKWEESERENYLFAGTG